MIRELILDKALWDFNLELLAEDFKVRIPLRREKTPT